MRLRPRAFVTAAWLLVLPLTAFAGGQPAAPAKPEGWQPALLERWLSSVEQHRPGELDSALLEATHWTRADLRRLWIDVQVLLRVVAQPRDTRFRVLPLVSPPAKTPVTIHPQGAARTALDALAARVRTRTVPDVLKRAALVHTDVATLAADLVSTDGEAVPMTASVMMLVGDGRPEGAESVSLHWDLGRLLVEHLHAAEPEGMWARDWYRATIGLGQRVESFDSNHLRRALRVIPNDASLLFLKGCQHEGLSAPLFQEFARPFRGTAMRPEIQSEGEELDVAAGAFRQALRLDPAMTEARVRLGRVLGRQGRHQDAVEELRRALAEPAETLVHYYAALFAGIEFEALGDLPAAVASYERATALAPEAPLPRLALARLAQLQGDRTAHVAQLNRALAPTDRPQDPWWFYRGAQARHAEAWLAGVRAAVAPQTP
jgi:hypothetical protein